MSFSPNILTKDDPNNSGKYNTYNITPNFTFSGTFTGITTDTTGYNTLIVNINTSVNSLPCGLLIQYSSTGTDFDTNGVINYSTVFYSDTVFANGVSSFTTNGISGSFIKTYPILKKYYRIVYTPSSNYPPTLIINSRISTQSYESGFQNSISTFENQEENLYDAFGKLRVSYPTTILDLKLPQGIIGVTGSIGDMTLIGATGTTGYINNYLEICQKYSGFGLTGMTGANASLVLGATGNVKVTSQSRKYGVYQPGKSLLFMASGIIGYISTSVVNGGPTGYYNRIGYFDDNNGLYFEFSATNDNYPMSLVAKKRDNLIKTNQQLWNIDKMDGMGTSGLKLDFTTRQLFVIDMQYVGVGRVRFGFYAYGKIRYCHQVANLNTLTNPYTYNINLPIRYEIDGLTGGFGPVSLTQICSTLISEGGYNPVGKHFSLSVIGDAIGATAGEQMLFALRGGGINYYHQNILPTNISLASGGSSDVFIYRLRLYLDPGINGLSSFPNSITGWTSPDNMIITGTLSVGQYSTTVPGNFTVNNSIILDQGVIAGRGSFTYTGMPDIFTNGLQITSDINNISGILVLTVQGSSSTIYGAMGWVEIY